MSRKEPLLTPALRGGRFENGTLPLDFVADLTAYQTLLQKLAKHLYRLRHQVKRVPHGFDSQIRLALAGVEPGSTRLPIERYLEPEAQCSFHQFTELNSVLDSLLQESSELAERTVAAIDAGQDPPRDFPRPLLQYLVQLSRNLDESEGFTFDYTRTERASAPRLTPRVARRIKALQGSKRQERAEVQGTIRGGNALACEVFVEERGKRISCILSSVREAERWIRFTGTPVAISGIGEFSTENVLERISFVDNLALASTAPSLEWQLAQLRELKDDWYDNTSVAPSTEHIEFAFKLLSSLVSCDIPVPRVCPTPEGDIRAEWSLGHAEVSLTSEWEARQVYLHVAHVDTGLDRDDLIAIATMDEVVSRVQSFMDPLIP